MTAKVQMLGRRFGRLVVAAESGRIRKEVAWLCRCDCGNEIVSPGFNLRSGNTSSCGCRKNEVLQSLLFKPRHGVSDTRLHRSWMSMRRRCESPTDTAFKNYGARGIRVCQRWHSFENFAADMGPMPDGMTLDRIDVNGNYEPGNCRWATYREQARNTRVTRYITHGDQTLSLAGWAENVGIGSSTIAYRLNRGWPIDRALYHPISGKAAHPVRLR